MFLLTTLILLLALIIMGFLEIYYHKRSLKNLPIRIHINGSRGKSSVTRLIASGLRAGGLKTLAKTTGTAPRVIDSHGRDKIIHRLRSASIGEQVRLLISFSKENPDAIVVECMAVNPQYQWISEHKMIRSTISVITNVRPDHLDEMGYKIEDNALSLSNTIPFDGNLVTVEGDLDRNGTINKIDRKINNIFTTIAKKRNTKLFYASSEDISSQIMNKFNYIEHKDNVALALKVCELNGVDSEIALKGMLQAEPDPGATVIWKLNAFNVKFFFVNLFAANDPSSTLKIFYQIKERFINLPCCIFLNTRDDRRYRTHQLLDLVYKKIKPNFFVIRGENLPEKYNEYRQEYKSVLTRRIPYNASVIQVIKEFTQFNDYYVVGIGNIVGWGEKFIKKLKEYQA